MDDAEKLLDLWELQPTPSSTIPLTCDLEYCTPTAPIPGVGGGVLRQRNAGSMETEEGEMFERVVCSIVHI